MLTPREPAGGSLAEASRLLQEGLQLLAERQREVDAILEDARERALDIKAEAEQRAQEITAEAERQRTELDEQVAALRGEVAALRQELASLRAPLRAPPDHTVPVAPQVEAAEIAEAGEIAEAADAAGTPRWGRPSSIAAAQQAVRSQRSRPRWLPPWLPFGLIVLAAAAIVATNVDGMVGSRNGSTDATVLSFAPTAQASIPMVASTTAAASVVVALAASATATATRAAAEDSPTGATTRTPRLQASPTASPRSPTLAVASAALTLPPSGARLGTPVALPGEAAPEGPIVAAYTAYSTYTVQPGDTLNRVATQFGVSGETIMRSSGLGDPNLLLPGQVLTIPRDSGWLYRAQPGDTLDVIALRFGLNAAELAAANRGAASGLHAGDLVFIPDHGTPAPKR